MKKRNLQRAHTQSVWSADEPPLLKGKKCVCMCARALMCLYYIGIMRISFHYRDCLLYSCVFCRAWFFDSLRKAGGRAVWNSSWRRKRTLFFFHLLYPRITTIWTTETRISMYKCLHSYIIYLKTESGGLAGSRCLTGGWRRRRWWWWWSYWSWRWRRWSAHTTRRRQNRN